jgi:hypothetical protein
LELSAETLQISNYLFYPNPTTGWLHIKSHSNQQFKQDSVRIEIVDMFGRVVLERKLSEQESKIDLNELNSGIYLVQLYSGTQSYKAVKISLLNNR